MLSPPVGGWFSLGIPVAAQRKDRFFISFSFTASVVAPSWTHGAACHSAGSPSAKDSQTGFSLDSPPFYKYHSSFTLIYTAHKN